MATQKFTLQIFDGGVIGGFSGRVIVNGKKYAVPPKLVWEQESINTEPYSFLASYDSADEVRKAATRFVGRGCRSWL